MWVSTIIGMKRYVNVHSGSGAVLAEVTSQAVHLESKSGDLTGRGLTNYGIFETRIGNIRVKYCKKVNKNKSGSLYVKIIDSNPETDEFCHSGSGCDKEGSDADLQFLGTSKLELNIARDADKYKSDFTNKNNHFAVNGSVVKGYLFISEFNPPVTVPTCPY